MKEAAELSTPTPDYQVRSNYNSIKGKVHRKKKKKAEKCQF